MKQVIPKNCDVVVVGGGPAGTIAAGLLAKEGIDVVLFEKERFPRNTVGESLIPSFWKFTDLIDASETIQKEGFLIKKGGIVDWKGTIQKVSFKSFGFEQPALHVERDVFDQLLLQRIQQGGVKVFEKVKALKINQESDRLVKLKYQDEESGEEGVLKAQYLIDASGQQAILANQHKMRRFDRDFAFQSIWGYYDKSSYFDQNANIRPFVDRLQYSPLTAIASIGDWGWSWHIILRDKVSVGIVFPKAEMIAFKAGGTHLEDRFANYVHNVPLISHLLSESRLLSGSVRSIRDYAYRSDQLVLGNCFLVGDAAAFVDPISSEGIPMAMYGAYLAAWAVINSLKKERRANFYKELFVQEFDRRLNVFKMLAFPGKLPGELLLSGRRAIHNFSEQEKRLIMAQAKLTGRQHNFKQLYKELKLDQESKEVEEVFLPPSLMGSKNLEIG